MLAAINWENVNLAGSFLLGFLFGVLTTLRVTRAISTMFRIQVGEQRRRRREGGDDESGVSPDSP